MAISIYLGGTTGAQDGTLEVTGDGTGINLYEVGSVATFHFRAPSGKQNSESVLVTAPVDCEVSRDGNTFTPTATYTAGGIQDSNTACYVKRIAITQVDARLETGLSTTPHCAQVAIENIILPDTTAPTLTGPLSATAGAAQVALDWADATDNVAVTGYDVEYGTSTSYGTAVTSATSSNTITGLTNGTMYYFRVRAYDAAGNKSSWITTSAMPAPVLISEDFEAQTVGASPTTFECVTTATSPMTVRSVGLNGTSKAFAGDGPTGVNPFFAQKLFAPKQHVIATFRAKSGSNLAAGNRYGTFQIITNATSNNFQSASTLAETATMQSQVASISLKDGNIQTNHNSGTLSWVTLMAMEASKEYLIEMDYNIATLSFTVAVTPSGGTRQVFNNGGAGYDGRIWLDYTPTNVNGFRIANSALASGENIYVDDITLAEG